MNRQVALTSPPASGVPGGSPSSESPLLLRYWQMFMRRRWIALGIVGTAMLLGIVVTILQTPAFTAETRLEIRRSQDNVTNVEAVAPQDADQDFEFYQTQYALLEARSLASRVVRRLKLAQKPEFFETFEVELEDQQPMAANAPLSREQVDERMRKATDVLLANAGISPIRGSALVDLKFTSPDPALSRDVANAWAEEFIQANLDRRFASSQDAREYLNNRLAQLRDRLEQSERDLVGYAANSGIVTLSSEQSADGTTRADRTLTLADIEAFNTELAAATADRVRAETRLRQGVDQAMIDNQTLGALREKRAESSAEIEKMSAQFGAEYPPLKALTAELREINRSIGAEEARVRNAARTSYEQAAQREAQLGARVNALKGALEGEQRDSIQYNIYQREVDTNRQLYDGLLQRFKEIGVAGVGTNNISIVDRAELPRERSSPNLLLNLLAALIAGFALAAATVFGLEQIDQSLKDPGEVRDLGLPLLGVIPAVDDQNILEELMDRKSALGEAYLAAQANLSFLTDHGLPDTIMLTSTRPAEGKSTSALAISAMLGRVGRRTVLVDADIRKPSINQLLALPNDEGLTNYLAGNDDLASLTRETQMDNLWVITTGPPPPNAGELLSGPRFPELVRLLAERFDNVVIDAPPVLGLADVPLISRSVDGVIYTIESNGVKMRGIQAALDRLRLANAHLFGALVTKYRSSEQGGYGYGYGYAYGYGYGKSAQTAKD